MIIDPIGDMLTRVRNAQMAKKSEVIIPFSKIKFSIAKILEEDSWIEKSEMIKNKFPEIKIELKYNKNHQPAIASLKRISRPSQRIYVNKDKLPRVLNDMGIAIISTSQGLMTNKEAKKRKLGGEILCEIY